MGYTGKIDGTIKKQQLTLNISHEKEDMNKIYTRYKVKGSFIGRSYPVQCSSTLVKVEVEKLLFLTRSFAEKNYSKWAT